MAPERRELERRFAALRAASPRRPAGGRGAAPAVRAAPVLKAPLLRCKAGPHAVLFDLRTLQHIDYVDGDVPLLPPPAAEAQGVEVDLRRLLGVEPGPPQALLYALPGDPTLRRLVVDAGSLRLLRVPLTSLVPLPPLLARMPSLRGARAAVLLDDGALGWLIDPARLGAGA